MQLTHVKLISALIILLPLFSFVSHAEESEETQRDYLKKQVQYDRWKDILKTKSEFRYEEFKLDNTTVSPWRIQRMQEIGKADRGKTIRYVLSKSDIVREAREILLVSVTYCPTRADAAEGLVDHLLGIQRPGLKLVEEDAMILGDLEINIPDSPEPAIFYIRGNILISVENAGEKAATDIRLLAKTLDEYLKKKQK
ncbi:MAG: hypothetical protein HRU72_12055 [Planctomycetia bacterium]|uniref:DUF4154 domain-containing protein n=1 Tax=Candidatus Brocadia sapporoensis TaxID=392547 RepID=A0A1V6LXG8_9BACT|nr:hypothetical protein [Candidatus Brocadia sapporoensis]MDG6005976.1 hypothetical protein [Candidatus Brocadia sp.]QOJ07214.1 MAG: hypothetical protein HRU72_12055 [Planctomycetia bacterium]TVL96011.1 MAG: hypothetical protein CV082_08735 [Candidatus Brocadia sp. BL1]OQD44830.1 hypothetical protein BIY37_11405 [Candidatus Brocadia sapporoensis]GJQ22993.1 MAG: hypothetical protein HBSAPP01_07830 [Candidatus Brocadia sapporoensis]